jgi:CAP-Gly domain-containing linker protein 1
LKDELEQELERMKEKLARQRKVFKNTTDTSGTHPLTSPSATTNNTALLQVCEICERPGHDIFSCNLLKAEVTSTHISGPLSDIDIYCEDCESHDHAATDCPHSLEVF